jgi:hypothetical protein
MGRTAEGEAIVTGDDPIAAALPLEPTESAPPSPQANLRSLLLARFERWLDQTLADEPPPRGVPEQLLSEATARVTADQPAQETDLYSLFSAMTGLTGEIRLQGRAFKQLSDLLSPLSETPTILAQLHATQVESNTVLQEALADLAHDADAHEVPFKQVCEVMIDLYDRLQRGLQTCDDGIRSLQSRPKAGWMRRLFGGPDATEPAVRSVQGIREAAALTLARLQAALQEWGVQRVGRVGEPFDPARMTAVEVRAESQAEPGSVLAVHRSGYAVHGTLKAPAQVTVSKPSL